MRFHVIAGKTLFDLLSVKRNLLFLALIVAAPVVLSGIIDSVFQVSSMTLANQIQTVSMFFIILVFFWSAGIVLVMFSSMTCGDFITKEESEGTLLLLTSKPVYRHEIIIGKYLAFLVNILLLEIVALLVTPLLLYVLLPVDPEVLDTMIGMVPLMFLYTVFVAATFGGLGTAFSSISRSRFKTLMVLIGVTMTFFLGFMLFRGYMVGAGVYDPYVVWGDVNYHLGNAYVLFLDWTGFRMSPTLQAILGSVTGTYDAADPGMLYDVDIGAMYPSIARTDYISPIVSVVAWVVFTVVLFVIGLLRFEKREIS